MKGWIVAKAQSKSGAQRRLRLPLLLGSRQRYSKKAEEEAEPTEVSVVSIVATLRAKKTEEEASSSVREARGSE